MSVWITRDQLVTCIEAAGWKFKDQTKRVLLFKKTGQVHRVVVPKRDKFDENAVRIVLSQAKFLREEVERFLKDAVK